MCAGCVLHNNEDFCLPHSEPNEHKTSALDKIHLQMKGEAGNGGGNVEFDPTIYKVFQNYTKDEQYSDIF